MTDPGPDAELEPLLRPEDKIPPPRTEPLPPGHTRPPLPVFDMGCADCVQGIKHLHRTPSPPAPSSPRGWASGLRAMSPEEWQRYRQEHRFLQHETGAQDDD